MASILKGLHTSVYLPRLRTLRRGVAAALHRSEQGGEAGGTGDAEDKNKKEKDMVWRQRCKEGTIPVCCGGGRLYSALGRLRLAPRLLDLLVLRGRSGERGQRVRHNIALAKI